MQKAQAGKGVSKVRSKAPAKNVDEYLAGVPEPAQGTLRKIRAVIRSAVPAEATEAISYGIPTFRYKGSLVAFAAFSKHCSMFPMSYAVMASLKDKLKNFEVSKGTIRFPLDQPLPDAVVKKIVKARIAEKERKQAR